MSILLNSISVSNEPPSVVVKKSFTLSTIHSFLGCTNTERSFAAKSGLGFGLPVDGSRKGPILALVFYLVLAKLKYDFGLVFIFRSVCSSSFLFRLEYSDFSCCSTSHLSWISLVSLWRDDGDWILSLILQNFLQRRFLLLAILFLPFFFGFYWGTNFSKIGKSFSKNQLWAVVGLSLASSTMGSQSNLVSSVLMSDQGALVKLSFLSLRPKSSRWISST